ncbi:MAG: type I glyceraldehyde-3-phosphate dehydrogenase, partial [Verrucomicrobiaceae bacterium]|nr:type I glyceraldehyde-3-phosphate dehydrogenase [Verrucomicrobiaceae bacterium]
MKIAINGFGRIGRLVLRAAFDNPELEFVRLNDSKANAETAAHLLEFDTVHGRWDRDISGTDDTVLIDGQALAYTSEDHPSKIDWAGIDIVLECSGVFRDTESLQTYLDAGVKKLIVAAPVIVAFLYICIGLYLRLYSSASYHFFPTSS